MFTVGSLLPVEGVPRGSTLLVVGPPMTGKRTLAMELLAAGFDEEGVAVVSTDSSAADIRTAIAQYADSPADELPLGVVDCVGDSHGTESLGPLDSRVNSPADLTGIGMQLTALLEELYGEHSSRLRVGLLSLTTMSMYAAPEQVVRFLHVVTNRIREAEGVGFVVAHADTMDEAHLQRLRSFVDGVVEVREHDDEMQLRVLGLPDGNTEWRRRETDQRSGVEPPSATVGGEATADSDPAPTGSDEPAAATDDGESATPERPIDGSLREIFDAVRAEAPTLTVLNYGGPPEELAVVDRYFDRHGVELRRASMDVAEPESVALLHRGDDLLASETVSALRGAIDIDAGTTDTFAERYTSDLLRNLDQSVYGASAADKGLLVDVSHSVELLANRTGSGTLHSGFQHLSNLVDDPQAARIYERLGKSGVDVHVYGTPDTETTVPGVTVHEHDTEEMDESWFVVYDGDGDPERQAALLARELDTDNAYDGFWTYESDVVTRIGDYLTATYLDDATAVGGHTD
jgi:KaiC/GvpD/RAD55 family RecA-like ATPase